MDSFAMLLVTLSAGPTEEFFFEHPRKALTEFLQSWRAKKQPPKSNNIQHYHMHYYPLPLTLLDVWTKAPDKRELDALYKDSLTSYGWTEHRYKFTPHPSIIVSSNLQLWSDTDPRNLEIVDEPDPKDIRATIDHDGILVRVPVDQQFVLHLLKKQKLERKEDLAA